KMNRVLKLLIFVISFGVTAIVIYVGGGIVVDKVNDWMNPNEKVQKDTAHPVVTIEYLERTPIDIVSDKYEGKTIDVEGLVIEALDNHLLIASLEDATLRLRSNLLDPPTQSKGDKVKISGIYEDGELNESVVLATVPATTETKTIVQQSGEEMVSRILPNKNNQGSTSNLSGSTQPTVEASSQNNGFTASNLGEAVVIGQVDAAVYYLSQGADPNTFVEDITCLGLASTGGHYEMMELLLDHGADPNLGLQEINLTPLMIAAKHGDSESVKILLKYKTNPNLQDDFGNTALSIAYSLGFEDVANTLILGGAQ
ncbi:ankyrin repeat domain-containing protein, partial [Neobacillus niacini]|uniref:ankyrin repeat domain-containing protein n=1 Tax=Neobacillus niacini TaxID=86668 RepID=UPI002FFF82C3